MKKLLYSITFLLFSCCLFAQSGIWHGGLTINKNGTPTSYKDQTGPGADVVFSGANLGAVTASSTVTITMSRLASWKGGACDVTDGRMYYRVYRTGATIPAYTALEYDFGCNCSGGGFACAAGFGCGGSDQIWAAPAPSVDLMALAKASDAAAGTYNIQIYWETNVSGGGCSDITTTPITATFTAAASLPVELASFQARKAEKSAILDWATASETNNERFAVERSGDQNDWREIASVAGNGSTNEPKQYRFEDKSPLVGLNFYRLRQIDLDGKSTNSPIRSVDFRSKKTAVILPNPAQDFVQIDYETDVDETGKIQISDLAGRVVFEQKMEIEKGHNSLILNELVIPDGLFLLQVFGEKGRISEPIRLVVRR